MYDLLDIVINKKNENTIEKCVTDAYILFHRSFRDNIATLIKRYPHDAKDKEGRAFWSGTKRFPNAALFNTKDQTHIDFIKSTANIFAVNRGIQPSDKPVPNDDKVRSNEFILNIVSKLTPPDIIEAKIDLSDGGDDLEDDGDNKKKDDSVDIEIKEFNELLNKLENLINKLEKNIIVEPADFEKDDDTNFHIDFITACSNLRATNYRIPTAKRHKCKMVAGKIIPALATTTASVTGLVMIEMLKLIQGNKVLDAFKDSSNNLGTNAYNFSTPMHPSEAEDKHDIIMMEDIKCLPPKYTKWDKTIIKNGDLTLKEFLDVFEKQTGLQCLSIFHLSAEQKGSKGYSKWIYEAKAWNKDNKKLYEERLNQNLKKICEDVYGDDCIFPQSSYCLLQSTQGDKDENLFNIPDIVYYYR